MAEKKAWVDTSKWNMKSGRVRSAVANAIKNTLDWALPNVHLTVLENVSAPGSPYPLIKGPRGGRYRQRGPQTNAGRLPVPIVWGQLRKSIHQKRISSQLGLVFSDSVIASYNVYVHDGTSKMRPRPFMKAAGDERRQAVTNRFKYNIQIAARKYGLT